jgi:G6PDH family F420-dependent oxidoreductase
MFELGYAISSEEHAPRDLVRHAKLAEDSGFGFALISDHFHPWIDAQGHSPFVWSVLGGIAMATEKLVIGTGVTCPTVRTHPAIIAQAAATMGAMMPGRFFLGLGTGENLNEHIFGDRLPEFEVRAAMFAEAVDIIRRLWEGENTSYYGDFYTVENARIYTLPEEPLQIMIAAAGPKAAEVAGQLGDGLVNTSPDKEVVEIFEAEEAGRPKYAQMTICYGESEKEARKLAHQLWPIAAIPGELNQELPTPAHFEQVSKLVTEDAVAEKVVCGADVQKHLDMIQKYADAGYDHVYVHQIGPDQEGFLRFYQQKIMPQVGEIAKATR